MESYKIENLTFTYPGRIEKTLCGIDLVVNSGEFITLCGRSGCGKTTLLRHLMPSLAPSGIMEGNIFFEGTNVKSVSGRRQASEIGFVMQNPETQIVTDKVWHELAFGAESLGLSTSEIRSRVSEIAYFFGINKWFHQDVRELSGGQKQILNLAAVMVMQPSVLILDEPTSQLDPISATEFLKMVEKINRELGVTVIMSEHRLEEVIPMSDRVIVMENGGIIANGTPQEVGEILRKCNLGVYCGFPTPMRVWSGVDNDFECPLTVRDGRLWLEKYSAKYGLRQETITEIPDTIYNDEKAVEVKDAWFRYEKNSDDIIKNLNLKVNKGEIYAITGGNGAGKTTILSLISGLNLPYRGEVLINGKTFEKIEGLYGKVLGVLPQNPVNLFVKKRVELDLEDALIGETISDEEKAKRIKEVSALCDIEELMNFHPYDLSGGEQQRAALAKVLLKEPEILLLDEPTKGMDAQFKLTFGEILRKLKSVGTTIIMVSHDIEFCAVYADRCALVFDGAVSSEDTPRRFFSGKSFYTTSANRMARGVLPEAVLAEDIIIACGGSIPEFRVENGQNFRPKNVHTPTTTKEKRGLNPFKIITGFVFLIIFALCLMTQFEIISTPWQKPLSGTILQWASILSAALALACFLKPRKEQTLIVQRGTHERKLTKSTVVSVLFAVIAIPLTVLGGTWLFEDKHYYFISILIIIETLIPFFMVFEGRKPSARELVITSVLCAFAVAGRAAFSMLPQFKPMIAVVIIAGVCFGSETGFLVGAAAAFVSNFFAGQGSWTPWQMIASGLTGFVGGILFYNGWLPKGRLGLSVFGFITTFALYGFIVDSQFVLMMLPGMSGEAILSSYLMGVPFNLIHGGSTALFLWFISEPMIEKLERIKIKYGLI